MPDLDADSLVYFGGAVKALGAGKVGGIVAPFATALTADPQGDYFTAETDFGLDVSARARVVYHHGFTKAFGPRKLGVADLTIGPAGLEGIVTLDLAAADVKALYDRADAGELYWSSGSADRLVARHASQGTQRIVSWPIIEVSLTPVPVDTRARARAIKSLFVDGEPGLDAGPSLADRSAGLVADASELLGLYRKAADQRAAEGRCLSRAKRESIRALADGLAALAAVPGARAQPEALQALRVRLLSARL